MLRLFIIVPLLFLTSVSAITLTGDESKSRWQRYERSKEKIDFGINIGFLVVIPPNTDEDEANTVHEAMFEPIKVNIDLSDIAEIKQFPISYEFYIHWGRFLKLGVEYSQFEYRVNNDLFNGSPQTINKYTITIDQFLAYFSLGKQILFQNGTEQFPYFKIGYGTQKFSDKISTTPEMPVSDITLLKDGPIVNIALGNECRLFNVASINTELGMTLGTFHFNDPTLDNSIKNNRGSTGHLYFKLSLSLFYRLEMF
ncbi:MAG: hypothetical protein OCC49_13580 [Fibrobacterales bacterium]